VDRAEATLHLRKHLDDLEALGYPALLQRVGQDNAFELRAPSGHSLQIEVSILWDQQPGGAIMIIGSIDDGGLSAFIPLTESRLLQPQPRPSAP
jgi:hypothetical protein